MQLEQSLDPQGHSGEPSSGSYAPVIKTVREDVQFRVLRLLQSKPHLSQREITRGLTLNLGGIIYCLRALVQKGQIKVRNYRKSNNKICCAYILTPHGIEQKFQLTANFLK
ncbi:MAG: EPS-associated MarR family transcriptional regulator [Paracoccaceae bacterium]|jgi:EPS-associated MarR family transcriptional regulator